MRVFGNREQARTAPQHGRHGRATRDVQCSTGPVGAPNMTFALPARRDFLLGSAAAAGSLLLGSNPHAVAAPAKPVTGLLHHPLSKEHDTGEGHPERPARFEAVLEAIKKSGLEDKLTRFDVR